MLLMNKMQFATLIQEQRFKLLNQFVLMLKSAEFVIVVTLFLIAVTAIFQSIFVVALMVVSTIIVIAKEHSELHLVYLQLFNLNVTFRCSYPLMISAFPQKNVVAIPKIPATHSEESVSPLTNSSRPTVTTAIADAVAPTRQITTADAVNKIHGDIGFPISP